MSDTTATLASNTAGAFEAVTGWLLSVGGILSAILSSQNWNGVNGLGLFVAILSLVYVVRQFRLERSPLVFAYRGKDGCMLRVRNGGRGVAVQVVLVDHDFNVVDDSVTLLPPGANRPLPAASKMRQTVSAPAYLAYRDALGERHETKLTFTGLTTGGTVFSAYRPPKLFNLKLRFSHPSRSAERHLRRRSDSAIEHLYRLQSWWRWAAWKAWGKARAIRTTSHVLRWLYSKAEARSARQFAEIAAMDGMPAAEAPPEWRRLDAQGVHWCWYRQYECVLREIVVSGQDCVAFKHRVTSGHQDSSDTVIVLTSESMERLHSLDLAHEDGQFRRRAHDAMTRYLNGRRPNAGECSITEWRIDDAGRITPASTFLRILGAIQSTLLLRKSGRPN